MSDREPVQSEARSDKPRDKDGLPVVPSLAAIGELVAAFLFIYGVDWLAPQLAILDFEPHPFWIPLLLLSLQYGTVSGLVAAGAAIAATMLAGLPEPGIGENHFAYFLRVWGEPILWIAMALLVGQFRMRQIAAKQELHRLNEALSSQRADLAAHCAGLRQRCEILDRELATRRDTEPFRGLAAVAVAHARMTAGGASPSLSEVLAILIPAVFPGARAEVFLAATAGGVSRVATYPAQGDLAATVTLPAAHPLVRAVVGRGERAMALDRDGERMLIGVALAAVPVRDVSGAIVGLLTLDGASPAALSKSGIDALSVVAEVIGSALGQAASTGSSEQRTAGPVLACVLAPAAVPQTAES
ncbi:MAG: hypothetical protein JNM89_09450 [Hyphomicrobiaceae bacterium]|nr:hypothetical protein [Hyphomicrobiaceae bacterium]